MAKKYTSEDLTILEGLDAVRMRPGMYIGTTGVKGLHHLLWEIVDNSVDEALNGNGNEINITLYEDGSASVEDYGRGMPVDIHPIHNKSGVEVIFTTLHAGAKFDNDNYSFSGGLHGVGASVTNALSTYLKVDICRDGKRYQAEFHSIEVDGVIKSGVLKSPLKLVEEGVKKTGTKVRFMPDPRVFGRETFNPETIARKIKELAFLNKGVKFTMTDLLKGRNSGEIKYVEHYYEGGLVDFVKYIDEYKDKLYPEPIYLYELKKDYELQVAMEHTDTYTESIFSYVNNIPTTEGGTHETGFKAALTRCLNDYARKKNILKEKDENLIGEDFREGLTAIIAIKLKSVQFEGQTKTKLGNPEVKSLVEGIVYNALADYLNLNGKSAEIILEKAIKASKARVSAKKARDLARQKNNIGSGTIVDKLASCSGKKAELNEIFIVEGDSAGGSAKQARDRSFQAILSLRGKPLNAEKKSIEDVLLNKEIKVIVHALGGGFDSDFDLNCLKYHKVIILADADQDGGHIKAILITFFYRYMRELINNGHLYIGMPPLYKIEKGNYVKYAYNKNELEACIEEAGKGYKVQRYKGLGEMNPEQLWDTTLNPKTRSLIKVAIEDAAQAEVMITTLMGDNIDARKRYIYDNANFNKQDLLDNLGGTNG